MSVPGASKAAIRSCAPLQTEVIDQHLCMGCGACVGICPPDALTIDDPVSHRPELDESRCTDVGLCYEVCPGKGYPVTTWARQSCDEQTVMHPEYGPVRHFWLGHAADPEIRGQAASGGVATGLLLHLLATGQVDEVAVATLEQGRPRVRLTADPAVVRAARQSKYSPVPMMEILGELRRRPRRIAATVLGCQMGAYRLAAQKSRRLRESLVLAIGLFCGQVKSYDSVRAIASTLDIDFPGEARFRGWRCGPYPGNASFELPDGRVKNKPLAPWLDISVPFYALHRCFLCPDGANWLADLTLGDIHAGGDDETVIVCRTKGAEKMLLEAREAGALVFNDMSREQVEGCVIHEISRSKLYPALARIEWRRQRGLPVPEYDYPAAELLDGRSRISVLVYLLRYRLSMWVRRPRVMAFLLSRPRLMEKVGHFIYRFPSSLPGYVTLLRLRGALRSVVGRRRG